jgi:hypothetical protein
MTQKNTPKENYDNETYRVELVDSYNFHIIEKIYTTPNEKYMHIKPRQ